MKTIAAVLIGACMAMTAAGAFAQDAVGNGTPHPREHMTKKEKAMMKECHDRMAMPKADGAKDDAEMKKDAKCDELMKKHADMAAEPMKK